MSSGNGNVRHVPTITAGQAGKFVDLFVAALRKSDLPSMPTQYVLEHEGREIINELINNIRAHVERRSEMIVRHFKLDPRRTRDGLLAAIGRVQYVNHGVFATMPIFDIPDEGDLYFFPLKGFTPVGEVNAEFDRRGLRPHPVAQFQVNADDPAFADTYPNGVQWGENMSVLFSSWYNERFVDICRDDRAWDDTWWFAGVRK